MGLGEGKQGSASARIAARVFPRAKGRVPHAPPPTPPIHIHTQPGAGLSPAAWLGDNGALPHARSAAAGDCTHAGASGPVGASTPPPSVGCRGGGGEVGAEGPPPPSGGAADQLSPRQPPSPPHGPGTHRRGVTRPVPRRVAAAGRPPGAAPAAAAQFSRDYGAAAGRVYGDAPKSRESRRRRCPGSCCRPAGRGGGAGAGPKEGAGPDWVWGRGPIGFRGALWGAVIPT